MRSICLIHYLLPFFLVKNFVSIFNRLLRIKLKRINAQKVEPFTALLSFYKGAKERLIEKCDQNCNFYERFV